jgi:c-di-GMP-related signal transduction protein
VGEGSGTPENSLARQPIFDSQRLVYGYELLFRSGPENCCGQARNGHFLALDDLEDGPQWRDLLLLADFIKIDVLATPPRGTTQRPAHVFGRCHVRRLAEKVETYADFERGWSLGIPICSGLFFQPSGNAAARRKIPEGAIPELFVKAADWADAVLAGGNSQAWKPHQAAPDARS